MNQASSKYLFYALGEIALVVIGILIALQVNNWNEERKIKKEEQELLINLNLEFIENARSLDTTILVINNVYDALTELILLIGNGSQNNLVHNNLDSLIALCLNNPNWERSEFVLKDLESSGRLSSLSNDSLKLALYEWSRVNASVTDKDDDGTKAYDYFLTYLKQNASLRQIDYHLELRVEKSQLFVDHTKLLSDIKFENAVDDFLIYTQQRIDRFEIARTAIQNVIKQSEKSIIAQ